MVSSKQVTSGLAKFADREIVSKLPVGTVKRVAAGAAMALALKRSEQLMAQLSSHPIVSALGVVDGAGNVDVDALRESVSAQIPDTGMVVDVPVLGAIKLFRADVDTLYHDIVGG